MIKQEKELKQEKIKKIGEKGIKGWRNDSLVMLSPLPFQLAELPTFSIVEEWFPLLVLWCSWFIFESLNPLSCSKYNDLLNIIPNFVYKEGWELCMSSTPLTMMNVCPHPTGAPSAAAGRAGSGGEGGGWDGPLWWGAGWQTACS